jgi:DNA-binding MarR family transcriptional regulator
VIADDAGDETDRLIAELIHHARLANRLRARLAGDESGGEASALLLLPVLVSMGPLRITDLAEVKQADPSTVSRQAAQLVRAGLARREADPSDGRASRLAVTAEGELACQRLKQARRAMLDEALQGWPAEELARFADLFHKFNASLEAHLRETV